MSAAASTVSAPTGQPNLPGIAAPAAASPAPAPAVVPAPAVAAKAEEVKPPASILGGGEEVKTSEKSAPGDAPQGTTPTSAGDLEIKVPDGANVDAAVLSEFKAVAKEAGLTSEAASKVVAWELARQAKAIEATTQSWNQQGEAWMKEIEADKDIGGAKLAETVLAAKKALKQYGGEALVADLNKFGLGNMPSLVRAFAAIGRGMAEDSSATGGNGGARAPLTEEQKLEKLYPSMNPDGSPKAGYRA